MFVRREFIRRSFSEVDKPHVPRPQVLFTGFPLKGNVAKRYLPRLLSSQRMGKIDNQ